MGDWKTIDCQEGKTEDDSSESESHDFSTNSLSIGKSDICPNNIFRLWGSLNFYAYWLPIVYDVKAVAAAGTCNKVSKSLWKLSRIELNYRWSSDIRIQSNEINWILLRWSLRDFFFHLFRNFKNSFLLGFNISLIFFVKLSHLLFCLTEWMTVLSFKHPSSKLFFHLFIFLLKLFKILVFEFGFTNKERLSFVKLFNIELFLFVSKNIWHFLYFFLINFKLICKLGFSHRVRKTFNYHCEIRGTTSFIVDFKLFNFFAILEDGKCQKPDNYHCYSKPTLNIIKSLIFWSRVKLLWT